MSKRSNAEMLEAAVLVSSVQDIVGEICRTAREGINVYAMFQTDMIEKLGPDKYLEMRRMDSELAMSMMNVCKDQINTNMKDIMSSVQQYLAIRGEENKTKSASTSEMLKIVEQYDGILGKLEALTNGTIVGTVFSPGDDDEGDDN